MARSPTVLGGLTPFPADGADDIEAFFTDYGYAVLTGVFDEVELADLEADMIGVVYQDARPGARSG